MILGDAVANSHFSWRYFAIYAYYHQE